MPARLETVAGDPPLILDAAHNAAGVEAVVESLPDLAGGRPVVALLAALSEKPIDGLCAPLAAACETVVCTEIPPAALAGVGRPGARSTRRPTSPRPARAPAAGRGHRPGAGPRARPRAGARAGRGRPRRGIFYLLGPSAARLRPWTGRHAQSCLQMMGLVAAMVAIVILVFFGLGYLFGSMFL